MATQQFLGGVIAMASAPDVRSPRCYVILNPAAGSYPGKINEILQQQWKSADGTFAFHESTGPEDVTATARDAAERGYEIVVAGGGDGTVAAVANGLVGTSATLGILPLGTANVVAQELGIPLNLEGACALLTGPHSVARIDGMEVQGRHHFSRVGIGLDALVIHEAKPQVKRRIGWVAYSWAAIKGLVGFQPRHFHIFVDGDVTHARASEVAAVNCGTMGRKPFRWGPGIRPDDGNINICIFRARNLIDFLVLGWQLALGRPQTNRNVSYLVARHIIVVVSDSPLLVQADGETIGRTPFELKVFPCDIPVIVRPEGIPPPPF
ncbi:diacylglycerol kinase family protein [Singulisphaera sp. Ch08]|uniref:Diacylglycerol kinase family protein n=1 Tax=Singulisphaera sp. Ch08 TaxID=3120278 RepID=A0AAU7CEH1_9BACT